MGCAERSTALVEEDVCHATRVYRICLRMTNESDEQWGSGPKHGQFEQTSVSALVYCLDKPCKRFEVKLAVGCQLST